MNKQAIGGAEKAVIYLSRNLPNLNKDKFKIVRRTDLVGEYLGHTAMKTQSAAQPIEFGFDHVYDADSTQLQVYEDVGKPVVDAAFQGFNTTVFAYGQTGSGKSWSMTGGKDEQRGLIPRINAEIFARIENSSEEKLYLVQCSYFEIYNEIVGDSASVSEVF